MRGNAEFSRVMTKNRAIARAIASIPDTAWTPVRYPGAVQDPDTGAWLSNAEVAYTAFAHTTDRTTARLVVRRVKDARRAVPDLALPPVLHQLDPAHRRRRHHPPPSRDHRNRVRRPDRRTLTHLPSGHFGANSAWALCAAIAHNLLHAAGILAGRPHAVARGATLRRQLITVPARLARPARTPVLHLPSRWPWAPAWLRLWEPDHRPQHRAQPARRCLTPTRRQPGPSTRTVERLDRPATPARRRHQHA
jgi:hypothetical protein